MTRMVDAATVRGKAASGIAGQVVAVISGGLSVETEISVRSGRRLHQSLAKLGTLEVHELDFDESLGARLQEIGATLAIPMVYGAPGESLGLRTLLELWELPYVGATAQVSRACFDKLTSKHLLERAGIPAVDGFAFTREMFTTVGVERAYDVLAARLGEALIVKPVRGGSGLGVSLARTQAELINAVVAAYAYDSEVLVERYVEGREFAIGLVQVDGDVCALPPVEIGSGDGVYDYSNHYDPTQGRLTVHSDLAGDPLLSDVLEVAIRAYAACGLTHYGRVDIRVDGEGRPHVFEVTPSPGLTETSTFSSAVEVAGLTVGEVFASLIG